MNRPLLIGIDMDDTIENLLVFWVQLLNEKFGTAVNFEDIDRWEVDEYFPTVDKDLVYKELQNPKLWEIVTPKPDAVEYIKKLQDEGNKIYICTSSHFGTIEMKLRLVLFKYFPYINWSQVVICSEKQLCNFDIMIDDYYKNLVGGKYFGILYTSLANKNVDISNYNNIVRADNWESVYSIVNNYRKTLNA